jgi:ribose/xylose/arabinose/galactoside ABC-type transport system permease subunit
MAELDHTDKTGGRFLSRFPLGGESPTRRASRLRAVQGKLVLAAVILVICIVTTVRSDVFLTWANWQNILQQISFVGILACGTTILMVSGGIDLSIGSNVSFTGMVIGYLMVNQAMSAGTAILLGILVATGIGLVNGILVSHTRTHPFILTLGMLTLLEGAALMISTEPITGFPQGFLDFAFEEPLGVPVAIWFFLGAAVFCQLLLSATVVGRHIYALGGSETAAGLAGVRVRALKIGLYTLMGFMVGGVATLLISTLSASQAFTGQGMELSAIAAVAVGGTPLQGGRGDIVGTLLGVLLIGVIGNSLNLLSINPNLQQVLVGAIIVMAVMAQRTNR